MNIKNIVSEEINKEINKIYALNEASAKLAHKKRKKRTKDGEDFIKHVLSHSEKDDDKKTKNKKSVYKKYINSSKIKQDRRIKNRDGNDIDAGDESQIRNNVNADDIINIAALARKVYPNHTPEGAQSQLRKKIKGLKNDNGSEYHLKNREAGIIRKELKKI